ncbi:uncharacterized protein VTP21DRAFT_9266 [Calcarisporiella thermophila]|uniref:uncharacterized protein n=1 Tax=Calcarisporiella thermophila TaxID=911321 RepID=UPI003743DD3C
MDDQQDCLESIEAIEEGFATCLREAQIHPEPYIAFSTLLELHLANALEKYTPSQVFSLLLTVKKVLVPTESESEPIRRYKIKMLEHSGWDIYGYLLPFLTYSSPTGADQAPDILTSTSTLLDTISMHGNPREVYLMILNHLGALDWNVDASHLLRDRIVVFTHLGSGLLQVLPRIKTKRLSTFLLSVVKLFLPALHSLKRLALEDSPSPTDSEQGVDALAEFFLSFLEKMSVHIQIAEEEFPLFLRLNSEDETESLRYLFVFILLTWVDAYFARRELHIGAAYYSRLHSRYNFKGSALDVGEPKKETLQTVDRIRRLASSLRLGFEDLVYYVECNVGEDFVSTSTPGEEEKEGEATERTLPLPPNGISIMLGFSILSCLHASHHPLPQPLSHGWLFRVALPLAYNSLASASSQPGVFDPALSVLLYTVERLDPGLFGIDELSVTTYPFQLKPLKFVEEMALFSCTNPNPTFRFLAFEALKRYTLSFRPEARAVVAKELLRSPLQPARAGAISLVKDWVMEGGVFSGKFLGELWRDIFRIKVESGSIKGVEEMQELDDKEDEVEEERKRDMMATVDGFWEWWGTLLQVVNFWIFILVRDKDNQTGIWESSTQHWMRREFLEPVGIRIQDLLEQPTDPEQQMKLWMLMDGLNRVRELLQQGDHEKGK